MGKVKYLTKEDFEIICSETENFFKRIKDPPPSYKLTYFEKLDSIIHIPEKTFDSKDLYEDIYKKAACYLYFVNKLHPFNNGNKRISILATGVFLLKNGIELIADQDTMYQFAKDVTTSKGKQDDEFKRVELFIRKYSKKIIKLPF